MYLSQFGYLSPSMKNPNSGHIMSEETMAKALMDFQSFAGLNLTGKRRVVFSSYSRPTYGRMSVNLKNEYLLHTRDVRRVTRTRRRCRERFWFSCARYDITVRYFTRTMHRHCLLYSTKTIGFVLVVVVVINVVVVVVIVVCARRADRHHSMIHIARPKGVSAEINDLP